MGRYRSVYLDPDGTRYGIPTYPWRMAPAGMATRRQLAAAGLRPGGQPVCAQVMWQTLRRTHDAGVAYLYRLDLAKPKRPATPAQLAALDKAMTARRTCPQCRTDAGYVIPAHRGTCNKCADAEYRAPRTCQECGRFVAYVIPSSANDRCADCPGPDYDGPAGYGRAAITTRGNQ